MKKYTIIGVIVLMSISLLGVVGLQVYWINNAITVKQQLFERNVHDALASVVNKLETREAVSVVTNQIAYLQKSSDTLEAAIKPAATVVSQPKATTSAKKNTAATEQKKTAAAQNTVVVSANAITFYPTNTGTTTPTQYLRYQRPDSLQQNAKLQALSPIKAKSLTRTDTLASGPREVFRIYGKPDTTMLRRILKNPDSHTFERRLSIAGAGNPNGQLFKWSVDTLRHVAYSLDSIKMVDISSVKVKNDSIYIFKKDSAKPYYVYKVPKNNSKSFVQLGHGVQFRNIDTGSPSATTATLKQSQTQATKPRNTASIFVTKPVAEKQNATPEKLAQEATQKIEVKKEKLNDVVQQMMVEYAVRDIPLKERLNVKNLQALLTDELKDKGIDLDYGYHVVSGTDDTIAFKPAGTSIKQADDAKYFATFLFPNDIIEKPDYLAVYFPDNQHYAIKSLAGMMGLSALFTLVIIATFGTTIHIIFRQKKLSEMKNDFINNMTHEFKTPIATISLATDAISNPKIYGNHDKIQYYTGIIKQENKRMNVQVENVLQTALLEKNDFKLDFKPVDVHILISRAAESIRLQVEERLGHLNLQLNALQHELFSDEVHLFNVICNLLDNANKYSAGSPEIKLVTQNVAGGILIAVEDNGMGMSKETQLRVFDKFYRVPTGNLHNVKGFGLGLSYVKAIVQAHKGNVKLKSELGKGSRFEIFLPLKCE